MTTFQKTYDQPRAFASFDDAMSHLRGVRKMSKLAAMEEIAERYPGLVQKYRGPDLEKYVDAGTVSPTAVRRVPTTPAAVVRFDEAVKAIMTRDSCNRLIAMERAAIEHPALLAAYQAAGRTPSDLGLRPDNATAT